MELLDLLNVKYAYDVLSTNESKEAAKECIRQHLDRCKTIQVRCLKSHPYFESQLENKVINIRDEKIFRKLLEEVMFERNLKISMITGKMSPIYILCDI